MHVDWQTAAAYLWPIGIALAIGLTGWWALMLLTRRLKGRDYRRARIARVISRPLAFALPMLVLIPALEATPLDGRWLDQSLRLLHIGLTACFIWLLVRAVAAGEQAILRDHPMEVADNLAARRIQTQTRVLSRVLMGAIILVGASMVLLTFPMVRQIGTALLASAGIIGLVAGIAAKPVFGNLIAGLQIALTQPIRLDDVVIVEGEWGRIEEITSTYVVVRIWDERRLVVPLQWFISNPFQNWTRSSAQLLGTAFLWLDHRAPMEAIRTELQRLCDASPQWDQRVCVAQVTETDRHTIEVRLLVSARNSGDLFDLRCAVREGMLAFLHAHHPDALPRVRNEVSARDDASTRAAGDHGGGRADTRSPGAETVSAADVDAGFPRQPAQ